MYFIIALSSLLKTNSEIMKYGYHKLLSHIKILNTIFLHQSTKLSISVVSNVLQIGESKISTELRVAKITKIRDEQSELENIPFKLHWDNDSVTFSRGGIIPKEEVHFIEPKERWEILVIIEFYSYESLKYSATFPKFERVKITNFLEAHWNDKVHPNKVTRLLNRLVEWNLIIKHRHNDYELNIDVLKEFVSK